MEFINMNPIGEKSEIEIFSDNKIWDLHNCADFNGYTYDDSEKLLIFNWDYGCYYDDENSIAIALKFFKVTDLFISEKDFDVPRDEDFCLDSMYLINDMFVLKFRGGQTFNVKSEKVIFCYNN